MMLDGDSLILCGCFALALVYLGVSGLSAATVGLTAVLLALLLLVLTNGSGWR